MEKSEQATLWWNVIEFLKDIARLGGTPGIRPGLVPGGLVTVKEAIRNKLVVIVSKGKDFSRYQLTFDGLVTVWENSDPKVDLVSYKVAS